MFAVQLCELAHSVPAANGSIICEAFQRRVPGGLYRPGIPKRVCVDSSAKLGLAKWRSKCSTQYAARLRIPYTDQLTRLNNMACIGSRLATNTVAIAPTLQPQSSGASLKRPTTY